MPKIMQSDIFQSGWSKYKAEMIDGVNDSSLKRQTFSPHSLARSS
jgi:hypothetical protein